MNSLRVVLFVLGLVAIRSVPTKEEEEFIDQSIINLTEDNFYYKTGSSLPFVDSTGKMTHYWFAIFYSPTCPHCKKAMPHWNDFANLVKQKGYTLSWLKVGAINCKVEKDLCGYMKVKSYPSFVFLSQRHKISEFRGDRNKDEWLKYAYNRHRETKEAEAKEAASQDANSKLNPSSGYKSYSNTYTKISIDKKDAAAAAAKKAKRKAKQTDSSNSGNSIISAITSLTGFQYLYLLIIAATMGALAYLLLGYDGADGRKPIPWRTASRYEDHRGLSLAYEA